MPNNEPISREEQYLAAVAGESGTTPDSPVTRREVYLAKAAGVYDGDVPEPVTREETYLKQIAENGGGGSAVLIEKSVTDNGTYNASGDNADGYSKVVVDVEPDLITKSITANGTYSAQDDEADGYSAVTVNVPNTYGAGDEGKVVQNGALVAQTSTTATTNGTINTTTNNSVEVSVPNTYTQADEGKVVSSGALVAQVSDTVIQNGVVDTTLINSLMVNVSGGTGNFYPLTPLTENITNSNMVIVENSDYIVASGTFECTSTTVHAIFATPQDLVSKISSRSFAVRARATGTASVATGADAATINSEKTQITVKPLSGTIACLIVFTKAE